MNYFEFNEMFQFARQCINKKNGQVPEVKVIVELKTRSTNHSVCLDVKEVGFDETSGTIYIEV